MHARCCLAGLLALLLGPLLTGDSLSRERREGTLGLLFLTDLSGWDIVLGKLTAAAWTAGYGVLAVLPVFTLPILLGGVTLQQVGLLGLALGNGLFTGLAVGLLTSSYCREARQATGLAISAVVALTGFPWVLFLWLTSLDQPLPPMEAARVLLASPFFPPLAIGVQSVSSMTRGILPPLPPSMMVGALSVALVGQHFFSWLLLWVVARRVRTVWQDKASPSPARGWKVVWSEFRYGAPERRAAWRRRWLDRNPFLWLAQREVWKPFFPWLLWVGLGGAFLFGVWRSGLQFANLSAQFSPLFIVIAHLVFGIWMITEAVQRLCEDRHSGALELLLTTSLEVRTILAGQGDGLRRLFLGPWLLLLLVDAWWAQKAGAARWSISEFYLSPELLIWGLLLVRTMVVVRWIATKLALTGLVLNSVVGAALGLGLLLNLVHAMLGGVFSWFVAGLGGPGMESVAFWGDAGLSLGLIEVVRWYVRQDCHRQFRDLASRSSGRSARSSWWRLGRKPSPG